MHSWESGKIAYDLPPYLVDALEEKAKVRVRTQNADIFASSVGRLNERCAVTLSHSSPLTYSSVRTSYRPWLHCTLVQPAPELRTFKALSSIRLGTQSTEVQSYRLPPIWPRTLRLYLRQHTTNGGRSTHNAHHHFTSRLISSFYFLFPSAYFYWPGSALVVGQHIVSNSRRNSEVEGKNKPKNPKPKKELLSSDSCATFHWHSRIIRQPPALRGML